MIQVTKTHLPNIDKYQGYVREIFQSNQLTNNGVLVRELENRLCSYLNVPYVVLVSNGTLALQLAYKLLDLKGEVLTTPFSFVATTSSLVWEGLKPAFVDIDPETFNLDYSRIAKKITNQTSCILPVHVFGNPCEVEEINKIAEENGLKVIYDAAHAFGTTYKDNSILNYGDVSILSFHSTKIFHTIEGGALIVQDEELYQRAKRLINFGFGMHGIPEELGINAKMNEFQAAMGLCLLDDIDEIIKQRANIHDCYMERLSGVPGISFVYFNEFGTRNYSYFPILLDSENTVLSVKSAMESQNIYPRRYFYPSLDKLPYIDSSEMKNSGDIAKRILCLPMYGELKEAEIDLICNILINQLN
ncbi:DegT/DnrJ/EryC1/StrS family aminotransferase [Paenibacillus sp. YSY-4.3]